MQLLCMTVSSPLAYKTRRPPPPSVPLPPASAAATCSSSVVLPTPGSPPSRTRDPGTRPPPTCQTHATCRSCARNHRAVVASGRVCGGGAAAGESEAWCSYNNIELDQPGGGDPGAHAAVPVAGAGPAAAAGHQRQLGQRHGRRARAGQPSVAVDAAAAASAASALGLHDLLEDVAARGTAGRAPPAPLGSSLSALGAGPGGAFGGVPALLAVPGVLRFRAPLQRRRRRPRRCRRCGDEPACARAWLRQGCPGGRAARPAGPQHAVGSRVGSAVSPCSTVGSKDETNLKQHVMKMDLLLILASTRGRLIDTPASTG